jgi:hypothetical protein
VRVTGAVKPPGAAEAPSLVVGVAPVCQLPPPAPPPMLWAIVVPASIEVASKTAANIFNMFFLSEFLAGASTLRQSEITRRNPSPKQKSRIDPESSNY